MAGLMILGSMASLVICLVVLIAMHVAMFNYGFAWGVGMLAIEVWMVRASVRLARTAVASR